jgi:hypothetical protein
MPEQMRKVFQQGMGNLINRAGSDYITAKIAEFACFTGIDQGIITTKIAKYVLFYKKNRRMLR